MPSYHAGVCETGTFSFMFGSEMKKIEDMKAKDWRKALKDAEYNPYALDCQCDGGMLGSGKAMKCSDIDDDDKIKGLEPDMLCYAKSEGKDSYKIVDDVCFTYNTCLGLGGTVKNGACVSGDTSTHTFSMTKDSVGTVTKKSSTSGEEKDNKKDNKDNKDNKDTEDRQVDHCGISTCTDDIWNTTLGGDDTCGSKVEYFQSDKVPGGGGNLSEWNACSQVANNHPDQCGKCFPEKDRVRGWFKSDLENNAIEFVDQNGVSTFDSLDDCISAAKKSGKKVHGKDIVAMLYRDEKHLSMPKTCVAINNTPGWNKTGTDVLRNPYEHETACLDSTKFIKNGCK